MKKRLILSGATVLLLIILALAFFILAKKYSPLIISHQPLNNNQNNQLETPNIESIGSINVDNQNFDIKLNAIKDGIVVAENGQPTRNDSEPKSPGTPMVSLDINGAEGINIPNDVIKISITKDSISPKPIIISAGKPTTFMVESADEWYHVLRFADNSLKALAVGVAGHETRLIRFNAPTTTGDYIIYDEIFGVDGLVTVK